MTDLVIRNGLVVTPFGIIKGGVAEQSETVSFLQRCIEYVVQPKLKM